MQTLMKPGILSDPFQCKPTMAFFLVIFLLFQMTYLGVSPVENKNDLELDFKVFFFADSCCSDIVLDESN